MIKSFKEYLAEAKDTNTGNYVSVGCLMPEISKDLELKSGNPNKEPHVTLIYSKESTENPKDILSDIQVRFGTKEILCGVIEAAKFDSLPKKGERDENKACIVLKLKSKKLEDIHEFLKGKGLKHSYPEFSPHLTLFYDVDSDEANTVVSTLNATGALDGLTINCSGFKSNTIIEKWNEETIVESTDLDISFASLVKNNNGMFKSDAQAKFLLSKCDGKEYIAGGSVYGNTYQLIYHCDDKGVTKVEKYTQNTGSKIQWTRKEAGTLSVQDEKELKRLNRLLKQYEKSIADRVAAFKAGKYAAGKSLYDESQSRDYDSIAQIKQMIEKLK